MQLISTLALATSAAALVAPAAPKASTKLDVATLKNPSSTEFAYGLPGNEIPGVPSSRFDFDPLGFAERAVDLQPDDVEARIILTHLHQDLGNERAAVAQARAAWNIELEVMRDIYCFPYRAGFVGIGDHGGWETELKREFKKRKKDPLALDEFAGWRRNTWDEHKAQLAFGMVEYLSRHEPEVLPRAAEAFRLQYKEGFKTTHPDGSWETNPAYQVPVEEQLDVLVDASDAELLGRATEFMTRWNRYRPRRRR